MKQRPWLFLLPALLLVSISAFIPLITVMNYSQLTLLPGTEPYFSGLENFVAILEDEAFRGALARQFVFSFLVLITEIPLGLGLALCMPKEGPGVGVSLVLLGHPAADSLERRRHHLARVHPVGHRGPSRRLQLVRVLLRD